MNINISQYINFKHLIISVLLIIFFIIFYIICVIQNYQKTVKEQVIQIIHFYDINKDNLTKYIEDNNKNKYYIEKNLVLNFIYKNDIKDIELKELKFNRVYKIEYYLKSNKNHNKILSKIEFLE